jgi:hypothetical protein
MEMTVIIIHQSYEFELDVIEQSLRRDRPKLHGVAFVDTMAKVRKHLTKTESQMLIFGTEGAKMAGIFEEIQALRDQYPLLVCALATVVEIPVHVIVHLPIEAHVDTYKDLITNKLQGLTGMLTQFLVGKLRRNNDQDYSKAPVEIRTAIANHGIWP